MAWGNWAVKVKRGNSPTVINLLANKSDAETERDHLNTIYHTTEYYVEEWLPDV